ncbi:MAG: phenylacetic acid degradation protein [Sulfobacillus acidophilus]|uniref:Phenylacetic acid degradation protein n=1 Tax=Sulfobacillus acidophilus TaxID=53633 RepID=A0A2T2WFS3_9FIRM|nr:MAG: phenylacetic acid degradation protein [Sulfobacillus acidophilus]
MPPIEETPVYEVFAQHDALAFATHVGSLRAPSAKMALELAREAFFRRDPAFDVWVVPATQIVHARDFPITLPTAPEEKSYRLPSGYDNGPQWKRFKASEQKIEDVAQEMAQPVRRIPQ